MKFRLIPAGLGVAFAVLLPLPVFAEDIDHPTAILERHNAAFAAGNVDAMLADYAEGAVFIGPMGVLRGHDQIGAFFTAVMAEFAKPGASFTVKQTEFTDNVAYFTWQAETADNVYELGGDTFVIEDGKIATQTLTLKATPKP